MTLYISLLLLPPEEIKIKCSAEVLFIFYPFNVFPCISVRRFYTPLTDKRKEKLDNKKDHAVLPMHIIHRETDLLFPRQ